MRRVGLAAFVAAFFVCLSWAAEAKTVYCTGGTCNGTEKGDVIYGSTSADTIYGKGGKDEIRVDGGGADTVDCGGGSDAVWYDSSDTIASNCESKNLVSTGTPDTTIVSWVDHDSPTPIDEDGSGSETTTLTYSVTNADTAEYSLDGGAWTAAGQSPFDFSVSASNTPHTLSLRAKRTSDGAVDSTPATSTMTMCPQAGCNAPPPPPQCSDGIDNDSDGKIDYPNDPGCLDAQDNDETDITPTLYFSDDFERDADNFVPPWDATHQWTTGRLTTDTTHARKGSYALKFYVENGDQLWGYSPRADLNKYVGLTTSPLCEGNDNYFAESVYFPTDFPTTIPAWASIQENGFTNSDPYGYPPVDLNIVSGNKLSLQWYDNGAFTNDGQKQITFGAWHDIVQHVHWSSDPAQGFMEMWVDGQPITFNNGTTKRYGATLHTACGWLIPDLYYGKNQFNSLTYWLDDVKLGKSYSDVAET